MTSSALGWSLSSRWSCWSQINPFSKAGGWNGDVVPSPLVQVFMQSSAREELSPWTIWTLFELLSFTELLGTCLDCNPSSKKTLNCTLMGISPLAPTQRIGALRHHGDLGCSTCLWLTNKQQPGKEGNQTSGNNRGFGELGPKWFAQRMGKNGTPGRLYPAGSVGKQRCVSSKTSTQMQSRWGVLPHSNSKFLTPYLFQHRTEDISIPLRGHLFLDQSPKT